MKTETTTTTTTVTTRRETYYDPKVIPYRIDVLIGGPMHGQRYVIEDRIPYHRVAYGAFHHYNEYTYTRRKFAMGCPGGAAEVVEFYADTSLDDDQAMRTMWDWMMRELGARPLR